MSCCGASRSPVGDECVGSGLAKLGEAGGSDVHLREEVA